jgi:uncharacterized protein DUF3221
MYRLKSVFLIGAIVLIVSAFTFTGAISKGGVDIRGTIIRLNRIEDLRRRDLRGGMEIEGAQEADTRYDKASIRIMDKTKFFLVNDGERTPASFADLKPGQKVEVNFTGPVAESSPVQATAGEVMILKR